MARRHGQRVVGSLLVYNEARRRLRSALHHLLRLCDRVVVLDDASSDGSDRIAREAPRTAVYRNRRRMFPVDESRLRFRLIELTLRERPDWIVCLDADERFAPGAEQVLPGLVERDDVTAWSFPMAHFWENRSRVRVDGLWGGHRAIRLWRPEPGRPPELPPLRLHCGSVPLYIRGRESECRELAVHHFGYARQGAPARKYRQYRRLDPEMRFVPREHYLSILDRPPRRRTILLSTFLKRMGSR